MTTASLIRNEKTKLLANALDRASTACLAVGVAAPVAAAFYSFSPALAPWQLAICVLCWLLAAYALHLEASRGTGWADPMTITQVFAFVLLPALLAGLGYLVMRRHERSLQEIGNASEPRNKTPIL